MFAIKKQRGEKYQRIPAWGYEFFQEGGKTLVRISQADLAVMASARKYMDSHK